MSSHLSRWLALAVIAVPALVACGDDSAATTGDEADVTAEKCEATFTWLQKDAYKSTAGRTSPLWPPHTTTTLSVTCTRGGKRTEVASATMENHGTKPDAVDANGEPILVPMKSEMVRASRSKLLALVDAYEACDCEAATKFLSLDAMGDDKVQALLGRVSAYLEQHLACPEGTDALVADLAAGDVDAVVAALPSCTWDDGADFASGLDGALEELVAASQEELGDYHVCNNDAELQAGLWATFRSKKQVAACDAAASAACRGPAWFYSP